MKHIQFVFMLNIIFFMLYPQITTAQPNPSIKQSKLNAQELLQKKINELESKNTELEKRLDAERQANDKLELKTTNLKEILESDKEKTKDLLSSAHDTITFATSINFALGIITIVVGVLSGGLLLYAKNKLEGLEKVKQSIITDFNKAMQEVQNEVQVNSLLAKARHFLTTNQRAQAEEHAKQIRQLRPNSPFGHYIEAFYLKSINDFKGAYEAMFKAHQLLDGKSLGTNYNLACYAILDRNLNEGVRFLETVYLIDPMYLKKRLMGKPPEGDKPDPDLDNLRNDPQQYKKFLEGKNI